MKKSKWLIVFKLNSAFRQAVTYFYSLVDISVELQWYENAQWQIKLLNLNRKLDMFFNVTRTPWKHLRSKTMQVKISHWKIPNLCFRPIPSTLIIMLSYEWWAIVILLSTYFAYINCLALSQRTHRGFKQLDKCSIYIYIFIYDLTGDFSTEREIIIFYDFPRDFLFMLLSTGKLQTHFTNTAILFNFLHQLCYNLIFNHIIS